jgi:uncharacterized RmlC-like cupin family protein
MEVSFGPVVIQAGERVRPGAGQTQGMVREQAFATDDCWVGHVTGEPGMASGWHHHDGFTTYFYVLSGALRLEFGPQGADVVQAGPGDFVLVPPEMIHRESNPGSEPVTIALFRTGSGRPVVNVDGP